MNLLLLEVKPEELRPWQWPREYSYAPRQDGAHVESGDLSYFGSGAAGQVGEVAKE